MFNGGRSIFCSPLSKSQDLPSGETHSKKDGEIRIEDVTIHDIKVGQLLTLECGSGKSFMHGAASIGVAYYAHNGK